MSTETQNGHVEHDAQEHTGPTSDTPTPMANLSVIAQAAHAERTQHLARIDQLTADRERINAAIAVERAEVERCDAILGWQSKSMQPRGKRKATQTAPTKKR